MKLKINVPDSNKPAIKISGIKLNKNPLQVLGEINLINTTTAGGLKIYEVINTDFPECFPLGSRHWTITDLFCNACNQDIHSYETTTRNIEEFDNICHHSNFPIFSKHKHNNGWKVIIYDPLESRLDEPIDRLIDEHLDQVEFVI